MASIVSGTIYIVHCTVGGIAQEPVLVGDAESAEDADRAAIAHYAVQPQHSGKAIYPVAMRVAQVSEL